MKKRKVWKTHYNPKYFKWAPGMILLCEQLWVKPWYDVTRGLWYQLEDHIKGLQ